MPDYAKAPASLLQGEAVALLNTTAEEIAWPFRAGEDYAVKIVDGVRSYVGKAWGGPTSGPNKIHLARRLWMKDDGKHAWMVTTIHEMAHLMTSDRHGQQWQEKYRHLLSLWGYEVEFDRTPGYETKVVADNGTVVRKRYRRSRKHPDLGEATTSRVDAGHYEVKVPGGPTYRAVREHRKWWSLYLAEDVEGEIKERYFFGRRIESTNMWSVPVSVPPEATRETLKALKREVKRRHDLGT